MKRPIPRSAVLWVCAFAAEVILVGLYRALSADTLRFLASAVTVPTLFVIAEYLFRHGFSDSVGALCLWVMQRIRDNDTEKAKRFVEREDQRRRMSEGAQGV